MVYFFFFQAEDGIRDKLVTGVQTCALPIFPVSGDQRNRSARTQLGTGDRRHGSAGAESSARWNDVRMERTFAGGNSVGRKSSDPVRAGSCVRVPDPGCAVRELRTAVYRAVGGASGVAGSGGRAGAARAG